MKGVFPCHQGLKHKIQYTDLYVLHPYIDNNVRCMIV